MRAGGGGAVYLTGKKSLRNDPEEDDIEPDGRGRAWKSAANLIELVGRDDEHDRANPIYGARLEAACVHGEDGLVAAEAVRRRVGVDPLAVQRRSFELADEDLRLRGIVLDAPFLDQLRDRILDEGKHSTLERERLRVDPDYLRRAGEIQSTGQTLGARPAPTSSKYAAEIPDGARARLAAQGVTVRFSSALQEFEVRYKQSKAVEKIRDGGGRDRGDLEKKHGRLLGTAMSEREAWGLAVEIMGTNALTGVMATG
jgi:hypothetical protein